MANYPSGTYSPSAVSNGQVIDAARDNAQDAEITAIEDALRTGLAHPVSLSGTNGLTVGGSLNVTGASTLASLAVTGPSTFTGAVTFSTTVTFAAAQVFSLPRVRLAHSADQGVASGAYTGLNWDTEIFDSDGMHSTAVNSSRITFTASTGVYLIGASVEWLPNSSGSVILRILVNDSTGGVVAAFGAPSLAGALNHPLSASAPMRIASTSDYATVQLLQNSGSTRSITSQLSASANSYVTTFWAQKVSA